MNEMQITSAQYISSSLTGQNESIKAVIDGVNYSVPIGDLGNRHYAEIMRQSEAGQITIQEAE